jgi:hypothetical protein
LVPFFGFRQNIRSDDQAKHLARIVEMEGLQRVQGVARLRQPGFQIAHKDSGIANEGLLTHLHSSLERRQTFFQGMVIHRHHNDPLDDTDRKDVVRSQDVRDVRGIETPSEDGNRHPSAVSGDSHAQGFGGR